MATILIIDDERNVRRAINAALSEAHEVIEAEASAAALSRAREQRPDAALLDLRLGNEDGMALLPELLAVDPDLPVIVLTAHGSIESCVRAMRAGAADYVLKPFDVDELRLVIERAIGVRRLSEEVRRLRAEERAGADAGAAAILGDAPPVKAVRDLVRRLAPHDGTVLIAGPSGTGKELVARALHEESPRRAGPFVVVNCAAIPDALLESELFGHERGAFTGAAARRRGYFEQAERGTIFLDEVGDLPLRLQPKLLRVLQDGSFMRLGSEKPLRSDARVVSATNRDLAAEVRAGRFREDLFYRLNTFTIELPPLAARRSDLPLLLERFVARTATRLHLRAPRIAPEIFDALEAYSWPGNVRELEHVAERLVVLAEGGVARVEDLPPSVTGREHGTAPVAQVIGPGGLDGDGTLGAAVEAFEGEVIKKALAREGGHRARTAKALGVSLRTLQYKLARYRIE
jgi:DNA-binding NtrC family response regulator